MIETINNLTILDETDTNKESTIVDTIISEDDISDEQDSIELSNITIKKKVKKTEKK